MKPLAILVIIVAVVALVPAVWGLVEVDIEDESASIDRGSPPRTGYEECRSVGCELCWP